MKKLSKGAYEDTKGFLRVAETLLEILILTVLYYIIWRRGYQLPAFGYKGKYVLMGVYAVLLYAFFQNSDCTMFGQLNRVDLIIGQIISLLIVNVVTYAQQCLIATRVLSPWPMVLLTGVEVLIVVALVVLYTTLYHKLYAPHNMLLIYGDKRGVELKIKMDSRKDKYNIRKIMSAQEGLEEICREMTSRGMTIPLMIGGATTSAVHTAVKLAPLYDHVFYGPDASAAAVMAKKCMMDRDAFESEQHQAQEKIRDLYYNSSTAAAESEKSEMPEPYR